ncbi:hypothetical protein [Vibrio sonorensis]|uniref:hypothetical protein n=1 Tax=Vibrio sonorensis TaxID=1004316 RepID=UPI0008DA5F88|nr:hypothetical protein [Vibrio sonorensis]
MDTKYGNDSYALGAKPVKKEDIRVVGNKLFITTNELDRELEIEVEVIESMIKVVKSKSA